jgi:hypothetical protein
MLEVILASFLELKNGLGLSKIYLNKSGNDSTLRLLSDLLT